MSQDTSPTAASAIQLLERSIDFGHGKLAVIRLLGAVMAGAKPSAQQWRYCDAVVGRVPDPRIREAFIAAASLADERRSSAPETVD